MDSSNPFSGTEIDFSILLELASTSNRILSETSIAADQEDPIWVTLSKNYKLVAAKSFDARAAATIMNMVCTQKRGVFLLSDKDLRAAYKSDPNHIWGPKGPQGFGKDDRAYSKIIDWITRQSGLCKRIYLGVGRQYSAYEVVGPSLRQWLVSQGVDFDAQRDDCLCFASGEKRTETSSKTEETKRDSPADLSVAYRDAEPKPAPESVPEATPVAKTETPVPAEVKPTVDSNVDVLSSLFSSSAKKQKTEEPKTPSDGIALQVRFLCKKTKEQTTQFGMPGATRQLISDATTALFTFSRAKYPDSPYTDKWVEKLCWHANDASNSGNDADYLTGVSQENAKNRREWKLAEISQMLQEGPDLWRERMMQQQKTQGANA